MLSLSSSGEVLLAASKSHSMAIPLGAHSPKLDEVRGLRSKAGRREQQRFIVEGKTMLGEALAAGLVPDAIFATETALEDLRMLLTEGFEDRLYVASERALARLSDLETPPGSLAVFRWALESPEAILRSGVAGLILAGVGDPGNAGTLLRSAEIFGLGCALFIDDTVEPYNSKVVRASMGATFRLRLGQAPAERLASLAAAHGYRIVATGRDGTPLPEFRFPRRSLIAVGNERRGVSGALGRPDATVTIPQPGTGESLNAAVAGSIVCYAFSQQISTNAAEL